MRCPKENTAELSPAKLKDTLDVQRCSSCQGNWLPKLNYQIWQSQGAGLEAIPPEVLPMALDADYQSAPLDGQAGLCPECGTYLKRSRITLKNSAFYVERCPICEGVWCDRGEWEVLEALGLHIQLPIVFSTEWQARVRVLEQEERERIAITQKLGPDIADKVFELGNLLTGHAHGDFAVAYLMRKFNP